MWYANYSKQKFFELLLGASSSQNLKKSTKKISQVNPNKTGSTIDAYWLEEPIANHSVPDIVVVPDDEIADFFILVNSSPHSLTPFSALCRVLSSSEVETYFELKLFESNKKILPTLCVLSIVESVFHTEGNSRLHQVTPAMCKRTLSFSWGRSIAANSPEVTFDPLTSRWIDSFNTVNSRTSIDPKGRVTKSITRGLNLCKRLALGIRSKDVVDVLAYALFEREPPKQEAAWREISSSLSDQVSLEKLATLTREDRAIFLQSALNKLNMSQLDTSHYEAQAAACAFIATRVAPDSLEHFELLADLGPETAVWYVIYATLNSPNRILTAQNGLGLRVLRDMARYEEKLSNPCADISYVELNSIRRIGIDSISKKLGHIGEVEIELLPYVTSSFTYYSNASIRNQELNTQKQLEYERTQSGSLDFLTKSKKNELEYLIGSISNVLKNIPDNDDTKKGTTSSNYRGRRK